MSSDLLGDSLVAEKPDNMEKRELSGKQNREHPLLEFRDMTFRFKAEKVTA
jgi:hypothetical protein